MDGHVSQRVLIVDDDPNLLDLLATVIESAGHTVEKASTGEKGLASLLAQPPSIAFLDINMPDLSGLEIARRARAALGPKIVLIALTGNSRLTDMEDTRTAGFDLHLMKPVNPTLLRRMLALSPESLRASANT